MSDQPPMFVGLDLGKSQDYSALFAAERRMIVLGSDEPPEPAAEQRLRLLPEMPPIAHGHSKGAQIPPDPRLKAQYVSRHVQRFELGTPYPDVVSRVAGLFTRPQYAGQWLVIDQTGVGAAVVDMFRQARREPVRCPKCGGQGALHSGVLNRLADACLACGGVGRLKLNARVAAIHIRGEAAGERWRYDEQCDTYYVAKRELISVLLVLMESNPGRLVIDPRLKHAEALAGELGMFRAKRKPGSRDESLEAWRERDHDDLVLSAAMCLWFAERANRKPWMRL